MSSRTVSYFLEDGTEVTFEYQPIEGYTDVGGSRAAGAVSAAITPAVDAAREVLARIKEIRPDSIEVKFGIKVSGDANWLIAKASTEANFEVTLGWRPGQGAGSAT